jgi:hypothetical protein
MHAQGHWVQGLIGVVARHSQRLALRRVRQRCPVPHAAGHALTCIAVQLQISGMDEPYDRRCCQSGTT